MSFKDKVVIITGASSGIGAETALHFAKEQASLVLCGRNIKNLQKVIDACVQNGSPKVVPVIGDVTDEENLRNIINTTITNFNKLDVLVNNAGVLEAGSIETTSLEQYDNMMNINVRSVFYLTSLAIPHLLETKGNIVNVSSVAGLRGFPNILTYCTSKAAVDQFTKCCALELAPKGVRVNAINPGTIVTDLHKRSGFDDDRYNKYVEYSKQTHAMGRVGLVHEVATAILFVASESASFITGSCIPVDGGKILMVPTA